MPDAVTVIHVDGGVFSPTTTYETFTIQPIEAIAALVIAFIIAYREKKKDYKTDGLSIPIMLMAFGYSRFFFEFARDNNKLFLGISDLAIHALVAGIVGTVSYFIVKNINKKKAIKAAA